jgi:hypothetical protein
MIQMLYRNNDTVIQEDKTPVHTDGIVQPRFEEHEVELEYLPWPAQSPNLNLNEPFWLVFETRLRNRYIPPTSKIT